MRTISWQAKLSAGRLKLVMKAPWIAVAVYGLVVHESPGLGTFAVTADWVLMVDPEVIHEWTVEEIAAVLFHEVMHVLRNHASRWIRMGKGNSKYAKSQLHHTWNVACDASINDDLEDWPLPGDFVHPKKYGLETGRIEEYYFLKLVEQEDQEQDSSGGAPGDDDNQDSNQDGASSAGPESAQDGSQDAPGGGGQGGGGQGDAANDGPHAGRCRCGSGAGNPVPNEPEGKGRGPVEQKDLRERTAREIQKAANSHGNVPAGIARWAEEELGPPKISWEDKLDRVCHKAVDLKAGDTTSDYSRPHRWQSALDELGDDVFLACPFSHIPDVELAMDTSGSMGTDEMTAGMTESKGVFDALEVPVSILAFDAKVQKVETVASIAQAAKLLVGGGGTSFVKLFDYIKSRPKKPDILVIFTDGIAPAPNSHPIPGVEIIWVLVGPHQQKPWKVSGGGDIEYGEFIEIPVEGKDEEAA